MKSSRPQLALLGAATMVFELLWARQLAAVLGSDLEGAAIAVGLFLLGIAAGQVFATTGVGNGLTVDSWSRLAILGCALSEGWCRWILPIISDGLQSLATAEVRILLSLPLVIASIPLGGAVTAAFRSDPQQSPAQRSGWGFAALDAGSAAGALATPLVLLPVLGPDGALIVGFLFLLGAAWERTPAPSAPAVSSGELARPALIAFVVGCISMALQMVWVRLLGEVLGSSLLVLGGASASALAGGALAGALLVRWRKRLGVGGTSTVAVGLWFTSQGLSLLSLAKAPVVVVAVLLALGAEPGLGATLLKLALVSLVIVPPAFFGGLILPALAAAEGEKGDLATGVGILQGMWLVGGTAGALTVGLWAVPALGASWVLLLAAAATVSLVGLLPSEPGAGRIWLPGRGKGTVAQRWLSAGVLLGVILGLSGWRAWDDHLLAAGVFNWSRIDISAGESLKEWRRREILYSGEGRLARVQIERDRQQNTCYMRVGGRVEGSVPIDPEAPSLADLPTEILLGLLPSVAGDGRGSLAVVGLGGGTTVATATAAWDGEITVCEIEEEVARALASEGGAEAFPWEHQRIFGEDARVDWQFEDARGFFQSEERLWNAIVCQPSEPWLPFASPLFTSDFHRLLARRLAPDGVVVQWLQLYLIGEKEMAAVLSSFREHLGPVTLYHPPGTGEVILVGSAGAEVGREISPKVAMLWQRAGLGPVPLPLLDDAGIGRWLEGIPGSSGDLRSRLEFRLPLLADGGQDQSARIIMTLREASLNR